jgi:hypothetical protein
LGLVSLSYLWRQDQAELFDEMIDAKVEAILIKVATLGLDEKHLGLSLSQVRDHLHKMVNIYLAKVEKILKGRLDPIPSPPTSVKIQIICGKVCLSCKCKTLLFSKVC